MPVDITYCHGGSSHETSLKPATASGPYPSVKLRTTHRVTDTIEQLEQAAMIRAAEEGRISPGNLEMLNEKMTAICIPASKASYALTDEDFSLDIYDEKSK